MPTVIEKMLAAKGKSLHQMRSRDFKNTKLGKVFRKGGVSRSDDFERILYIPRRRWQDDPELENVCADLTDWLALPPREECRRQCGHETIDRDCDECKRAAAACVCRGEGSMSLRTLQGAGLQDLHDLAGLFAPVRVGGGKTLLSMLAGVVLGAERPLLLVPAKLAHKTKREFALLRRHWLYVPTLSIMSYELLSRDRGGEELLRILPDLIIADEVHKLKNTKAGCTRKVRRYMRENPDTVFCAMSGTITTRSLREYDHILKWCTKDHTPLPRIWGELQDWADALDTKVNPQARLRPGALFEFCNDEELAKATNGEITGTDAARMGFRRRLTETPGVVATEEGHLGVSISCEGMEVELEGSEIERAFYRLREDWETPDGHALCEAMELWRVARELACGLFYKWDPPAPKEWMAARKDWNVYVREALKGNRRGIDTEFQVAKACKNKEPWADYSVWKRWHDIRPSFKPNSVPVWISDAMLNAAADWLHSKEGGGLCWVEHKAFGYRLSEYAGVPYYAAQGLSDDKQFIEDQAGGPAIVSIAANSEGRNLQHHWNTNLIVSCPPNGRIWEQLMGRTHRSGQDADDVTFTIPLACLEQWNAFQQACSDARYIEHTTGQAQKLLYADITMPTPQDIANRASSILWRPK